MYSFVTRWMNRSHKQTRRKADRLKRSLLGRHLELLEDRVTPSIAPLVQATGFVSLSIDGLGANNSAGGIIQVAKPAGATVQGAYMAAASTGFSGYALQNGDITIDGVPVNWTTTIANSIASTNSWADVTTLVKPKIDAAATGRVDFLVSEGARAFDIEGAILAVVFNDPNQTTSNTIALLFGAQQIGGDTFSLLLAQPIDKSIPGLGIDMSLGISFGFQPDLQFSLVNINGQRLTTSAGGQDDGVDENGALLTVGGSDDTNANPADPLANGNSGVRYDDELYDLLPFLNNGDTNISVFTQNESSDDNIFFSAFSIRGATAVVGEGIVLAPPASNHDVGTQAAVTAAIQDDNGLPIANRSVTFAVTQGPNAGLTGNGVTDANGHATFSYTSSLAGNDVVVARFTNSESQTLESNPVTVQWNRVNQPPVARDDSVTIPQNAPAAIAVLANDTDPDGTVNPATVAVTAAPAHGTVSVDAVTGVVTYTPAAGYFGPDTFRYVVNDNDGNTSNEATVTVAVNAPSSGVKGGHGFWKNHLSEWPVTTLTLGGFTYSQSELLALLSAPTVGDARIVLARQLIAAKLNVAAGATAPANVQAAIAQADALLASLGSKITIGSNKVKPSSAVGQQMVDLAGILEGFNESL